MALTAFRAAQALTVTEQAQALRQPVQGRQLLGGGAWGALDQGVLSAFSLVVGMAFIRFAPKAEYAAYALLMTGLLLAQSVQNALVSAPMTTLLSAKPDHEQQRVIMDSALRLQSWLMAAVGAAGLLIAAALGWRHAAQWPLVLALALGGMGSLAREFVRASHYLRHAALRALLSDLAYVTIALIGIGIALWADSLSAAAVLAVIGVAGVGTGMAAGIRLRWPFSPLSPNLRNGIGELWSCAKWALPSVLNSWLYANAFLFIVGHVMSHEAVADLAASRLLLVPVSLLVIGWTNAFRPRASRLFAAGEAAAVHGLALRSAWALALAAAAYGLLLYLAMPAVQSHFYGSKYDGLGIVVAAWLAYFIASGVRGVGTACMLSSAHGFRAMYGYSWLALVLAVPAVWLACMIESVSGVVLALAGTETLLAVVIWLRGWPRLRDAK